MGSVSQKATEKSLGFVVGPGRPEFCVELRRLLELWGLSRFRSRPTDGARRAAMADGQIGGDGQGTAFCSGLGEFTSGYRSPGRDALIGFAGRYKGVFPIQGKQLRETHREARMSSFRFVVHLGFGQVYRCHRSYTIKSRHIMAPLGRPDCPHKQIWGVQLILRFFFCYQ